MRSFLRRLFRLQPPGFTLKKSAGGYASRIRGDLVPADSLVIIQNGRHFVRTGRVDDQGFEVYAEGHKAFEYVSHNS